MTVVVNMSDSVLLVALLSSNCKERLVAAGNVTAGAVNCSMV